jgi:glycosyltransferase involved in cell wall biosynthesis
MIADGTAPLAELKTLVALIRLLRQLRPRLVLGFTPKGNIYAGLAARATGTPFLPNVSGLGTAFIKGGLLLKVQAALYREAFRSLPFVFFQNRDDAALFESMGLVRKHQVRLIPGSGVDCRKFSAAPPPERRAGEASLLFVGRLLGDKGVRELAGAMRLLKPRYPGLSLTLLGDLGAANRTAVSRAELQGWEREGLLIHAGRSDDVRPFMAKADAVVLPSYREGMPRALLEAAAMSRPLLAADVPGCREIVRDGVNGLLFEVRSEERLAEAIERFLLASFAERRGWAVRAREIAEREYDERLVVDAYRDAVIALTGKGG